MISVKITSFTGIDNQGGQDRLGYSQVEREVDIGCFAAATNVDIDDDRRIVGRSGYTTISADPAHSLFHHNGRLLYRSADSLFAFDPMSETTEIIDSGLTGETVYTEFGGKLLYSDGIVARSMETGEAPSKWGVTPPMEAPVGTNAFGALPPGDYLATMTFTRDDGEESGAPTPLVVRVTTGGIHFDGIPPPTDSDVTNKTIYLSTAGGELLFAAMTLDAYVTSATYSGDGSDFGVTLDAMHKTPPPPTQVIAVWNGRAIIGAANFVLYSDIFLPERFNPLAQSIPFDSAVTMLAALTPDACIVATETSIYRLEGADIEKSRIVKLADYGAIRGSVSFYDRPSPDGVVSRAAVFVSSEGVCMVGGTGDVVNMTGLRYAIPYSSSGASVIDASSGNHKAIFTLL